MALRVSPLAAILVLCLAPVARADSPRRLTWDELPQLVGKQVSIPLYDGGAVAGRVREVQADALLVEVTKSSNVMSYPKGPMRVPRATLHVLDVHGKGFKYRVIGTVIGFFAGGAASLGVAIGMQGGLFGDERPVAAPVVALGTMAGVTAAGYAVGNAADRRTTTVQIVP